MSLTIFSRITTQAEQMAKRLHVYLALALLSMIVLVVVAQWNLGKAQDELARTLKAIDTLHLIQVRLLTAERQSQAYVLSKHDGALRAFQESRQQAMELFDILSEWMSDTPAYGATTEAIKSLMLQELILLESIAQQDAPPYLLVKHLAAHEAIYQQLESLDRQLDEQLMETGLEQAETFNLWALSILAMVGMSGWLIAFILHRREARGLQSYAEEANLED